ncbi:MAG: WbqC family protein [Leeuwenhoekiella sp.]
MAKSIAIMQPYFFPYVGYFQLVNAVDEFIVFDDVNFIKKGWINRNYISANGKSKLFTVPLLKPSQNKLIKETEVHPTEYLKFKKTFLATLKHTYSKSPYFEQTFSMVEDILAESTTIANLALKSVITVAAYLEMKTDFMVSSDFQADKELKGQDRILNLCTARDASEYLNLSGGKNLYQVEDFQQQNIELKFVSTDFSSLKKIDQSFNFQLSVIHLLMHFSPRRINDFLKIYNLT